jgi:hypothetical protein
MALLTAVSVLSTATTVTGAAVSASDTIAAADIGVNGALLNVNNGSGGSINVTLLDPGPTDVGNAGTTVTQAVANGAGPVVPAHPAARQPGDRRRDGDLLRHDDRHLQADPDLRGPR